MNDKTERLQAVVRGRVQGVSFRYYTQCRAESLGLTGWVRNLPDRSVKLVAEGPRADLDALVSFLWEGPPAARVTDVETHWLPATGQYSRFEITG
jgi:acylphosphatase